MRTLALPCPVLIGRADDLSALQLLIEQAGQGRGGLALISGEAGIGKSRLVQEAKAGAAPSGVLFVQGSCYPSGAALPYAPILDLLRSLFQSCPPARAGLHARQVVEAFRPWFSDLFPEDTPAVFPLSAAPPQDAPDKLRFFELLTQFLTILASRQPLVLVVEDLHWCDETSLEFLLFLARRIPQSAILLLLTLRSDETGASLLEFLGQLDRARLGREFHLSPLPPAEVELMLQAVLALPMPGLAELFYAVYPLAEGNPFFIEELLNSLVAGKDLFIDQERWTYRPSGRLYLPRSVRAAVQQRLALLDDPAQKLLALAAVAGPRFDFSLLQSLTHQTDAELLDELKRLVAAQLVYEEAPDRFAFRHALTRQAVYAGLLARQRSDMHALIAKTLEERYAASLETVWVDLAEHYYEAGDWSKTITYAWQAGEKALGLYAPRGAVELLTRALTAAARGSASPPAQVYHLRGRGYETLGDFAAARRDYETALARGSDANLTWRILIDLGSLWAGRDYARCGDYYRQALELAREIRDPLLLADNLNRLGNWHTNLEQPVQAVRYQEEALALFQKAGDMQGTAVTLDLLGLTCFLKGDTAQGASYLKQAEPLFRQADDRRGLASCLSNLVLAGGMLESEVPSSVSSLPGAEALASAEEALKLAREIDQRPAVAYALFQLGHCLGARGEYSRALPLVQEGLQMAADIDHRQWMTYGHWVLGVLYLDLLAFSEAQRHLELAHGLAREIGSVYWLTSTAGLLGRAYTLQDDLSRADAILKETPLLDAPPQTFAQRMVCRAQIDLACKRGDPDRALRLLEMLMAGSAQVPAQSLPPTLLLVQAGVLALARRDAEAREILTTALDNAGKQDLRPLLWRIQLSLGEGALALRLPEEARQAFSAARALTQDLGEGISDTPLREQFLATCAARIPQPAALTPRRAAKMAFGGLTGREQEVAVLISRGKSNPEIARELVVGRRTVETHVSSILSKLNFTTRTQIALWVQEKKLGL